MPAVADKKPVDPPVEKPVRVRALKDGFNGNRIRKGMTFTVKSAKHVDPSWMQVVPDSVPDDLAAKWNPKPRREVQLGTRVKSGTIVSPAPQGAVRGDAKPTGDQEVI